MDDNTKWVIFAGVGFLAFMAWASGLPPTQREVAKTADRIEQAAPPPPPPEPKAIDWNGELPESLKLKGCPAMKFERGDVVRLRGIPGSIGLVTSRNSCTHISVRTRDWVWQESVGADYVVLVTPADKAE